MFIELTDHLRCPEDHEEQYLVLLPDRTEGRSVRAGQLGCPVCGRSFRLSDGVLDIAGDPAPPAGSGLEPTAIATLAGLSGPGGFFTLVGRPAGRWRELAQLNPGVALVAVNPGAEVVDEPGVSVIRGDRLPLKSRSMRGVVLGPPYGGDPHWVEEAARVVLPGLRIVGEGPDPPPALVDLLATAGGVWVANPRR